MLLASVVGSIAFLAAVRNAARPGSVSATSSQLSEVSGEADIQSSLLIAGCWLLITGYCLLAAGYWLLKHFRTAASRYFTVLVPCTLPMESR